MREAAARRQVLAHDRVPELRHPGQVLASGEGVEPEAQPVEAERIADTVTVLHRGVIRSEGPVHELVAAEGETLESVFMALTGQEEER